MSNFVNVTGTWRPVLRQFVNVGGTWRIVNRTYVNVNGTWRLGDVRVPGAPTSANITVNNSSTSSQTTTTSPLDVDISWTVGELDASFSQVVRWYVNNTQYGSAQDVAVGTTTASVSVPISLGETKNIYADVRLKNEDPAVSGSAVLSSNTPTSTISVNWPAPTIFNVQLSANFSADTFTVTWQSSNVPSGYSYGVQWTDTRNNQNPVSAGLTGQLSRTVERYFWGFDGHGYDLQEFFGDNEETTFTATVFLYDTNNNLVSNVSASGSATFLTATGGGI